MLSTDFDEQDGAPVWWCAPGTELPGGFLAWDRLAVGPRCETWLVWSARMWCPAVLKMVRPHHVTHPCAVAPLAREAAALHGNQHPALPRLYLAATTAPLPHIAVEYVDGPTLEEELRANGPLDEPEVALLGAQLLTGLLALHHRGMAHVDLQPASVLLRDQRPVLTGFGAACPFGTRQPLRHAIGAPGYTAPELEACEPVAASMDLYSLGVILHEALTGRPVFDPAPERPGPRPLEWTPVTALVLALIEPDPTLRPSTREALITLARAVPDDLRPWPAWADAATPRAVPGGITLPDR
jgi:serine/threonine protein kinase